MGLLSKFWFAMSDLDGSPWLIIYIGDGGHNGIL